MMNLQELESIKNMKLNIKLVVLDNDGYLSIKQTQSNFFNNFYGSNKSSGLSFPDFNKLITAFNISCIETNSYNDFEQKLHEFISHEGPNAIIASLDTAQEFEPRLKSRKLGNTIVTPELDDMHPNLPEEEIAYIRKSAEELIG